MIAVLQQVAALQYDVVDDDTDAFPGESGFGSRDSHGTSCAGEIGMQKGGDGKCGVGVAYNVFLTGLVINTS